MYIIKIPAENLEIFNKTSTTNDKIFPNYNLELAALIFTGLEFSPPTLLMCYIQPAKLHIYTKISPWSAHSSRKQTHSGNPETEKHVN